MRQSAIIKKEKSKDITPKSRIFALKYNMGFLVFNGHHQEN